MYRSQFLPSAEPVGSMAFFQELGSGFTQYDGSEYLKTGLAKSTTGYDLAARSESTQVFGLPCTGNFPTTVKGYATNGTGTIVVADGDATNVRVSTNNGATWSNVAHNLATPAVGVAFNGTSTWVVIGNTTSAFKISSTSAPQTSWTARTPPSSFSAGTADSASVCWDQTNLKFACVAAGGTSNFAAYSSDGTSWTAISLSVSLSVKTSIAASTTGQLVAIGNGVSTNKSSNATSWSTGGNISSSSGGVIFALGTFMSVYSDGSSARTIQTTTDGTTWTSSTPNITGSHTFLSSVFNASGNSSYVMVATVSGNVVFYTTNLTNWKIKQTTTVTPIPLAVSSTKAFFVSSSSKYTLDITSADYVGSSHVIFSSSSTNGVGYMKIK